MLGLRCFPGFSLVVESKGYSPVAVLGLLTAVVSLVAKHRLWVCGLQLSHLPGLGAQAH